MKSAFTVQDDPSVETAEQVARAIILDDRHEVSDFRESAKHLHDLSCPQVDRNLLDPSLDEFIEYVERCRDICEANNVDLGVYEGVKYTDFYRGEEKPEPAWHRLI